MLGGFICYYLQNTLYKLRYMSTLIMLDLILTTLTRPSVHPALLYHAWLIWKLSPSQVIDSIRSFLWPIKQSQLLKVVDKFTVEI